MRSLFEDAKKTKMAARSATVLFLIFWCNLSFVFSFDCKSKSQKLQVHLVPHSHDDVGWQKTVDQYYYGSNVTIQAGAVQYILDSVIAELPKHPNRTFIYVEMAFFKRWWDEQDDDTRKVVKDLVKKKQLEFINGGWSMNDEAGTHYNAIIDQMTYGLLFIEETFGSEARPTIAWQIDPFGHSAEQASLFSLMSFDGLFFGRIDHDDKQKRVKEQQMEMIWRGSRNYEKLSQIFTGVLYNGYDPPKGFCYDNFCADPPIQDDPNLFNLNVERRVDAFVEITCEQASHYKTNNVMLTMGSDFQYENAERWYKNLDKLIRYVNEDGRVNVFYSTPSHYLKALHDANKEWEVKKDDFFPYSHCDHCYWTGYFTSRPTQKGYIRESNNILQACKQMETMGGLDPINYPSSDRLRRAMAVNQHHDAVTGTEKQHVTYDYFKRLSIGREECKVLMSKFLAKKFSKETVPKVQFTYCDYLNISVCKITETERSVILNVYNPVGRNIKSYARIPVNSQFYSILNVDGEPIRHQIARISAPTSKLRRSNRGFAGYELVFEISAPPLGFSTYFLNRTESHDTTISLPAYSEIKEMTAENNFIENDLLRLEFSEQSGRLVRINRKDLDLSVDVDQQFFWYNGSTGNDESIQTSGAYIFRPNNSEPYEINTLNVAKVTIVKGPVFEEVHQTFGDYVSQVIRLYGHEAYAEFEHTIGPIPIKDQLGKEIITRFDSSIESEGKFYTDANGREMKERVRDHRDTWPLNITEPVAGNYYPVNSRIFINDSHCQLTVLSDRSQGGSSIKDGQIEIMLHRRLLRDDFLGVGEALNEPGIDGRGLVTRGKHRVLLTMPKDAAKLHRTQGELMMMQSLLSFAPNSYNPKDWKEKFNLLYSGLSRPLPDNIHLLTMETIKKDDVILRFENFYENYERNESTKVNLDGLFKDFKIVSLTEMNLSANQPLKDKKIWDWNTKESSSKAHSLDWQNMSRDMIIQLKPMEIRTFVAKIELTTKDSSVRMDVPKKVRNL